jgi:hypothetical protein
MRISFPDQLRNNARDSYKLLCFELGCQLLDMPYSITNELTSRSRGLNRHLLEGDQLFLAFLPLCQNACNSQTQLQHTTYNRCFCKVHCTPQSLGTGQLDKFPYEEIPPSCGTN